MNTKKLHDEAKEQYKKAGKLYALQQMLRMELVKHELLRINLHDELARIQAKTSNLSRSRRDAVLHCIAIANLITTCEEE